jgi:hypothetical protein
MRKEKKKVKTNKVATKKIKGSENHDAGTAR